MAMDNFYGGYAISGTSSRWEVKGLLIKGKLRKGKMAKNGPGENGGGELIYKGKWGGYPLGNATSRRSKGEQSIKVNIINIIRPNC